jgi:hypothetical protein
LEGKHGSFDQRVHSIPSHVCQAIRKQERESLRERGQGCIRLRHAFACINGNMNRDVNVDLEDGLGIVESVIDDYEGTG